MARNNFDQTGLGPNVKLGKNGARVVSTDGAVIEARNNADDAFAILRADHPINDHDVVTKRYLETRADVRTSGQIDGGSPPAAGTQGRVFVCTTAGGTFNLNHLYYDTGGEWQVLPLDAGLTMAVTTALTGGTIEFEDDSKYIWDADTTVWKFIGSAGIATGVQVASVDLDYTEVGPKLLRSIPGSTRIPKILVIVTQIFNGTTPELSIGDSVDPDRLVTESHVDLTSLGVYEIVPGYLYGAATDIIINLSIGGAPSTGQAAIYMEYSN